ncbi:hypothetical protein CWO84_11085 [Methylomonas sp. Kb3]|nr:hypothetical protein CWO84_11085 [Methylomonas sp. Kb3]
MGCFCNGDSVELSERLVIKLLILAITLGVYFLLKTIIPNLEFESLHKKVILIVAVTSIGFFIFVTFKYGM